MPLCGRQDKTWRVGWFYTVVSCQQIERMELEACQTQKSFLDLKGKVPVVPGKWCLLCKIED